MRGVLPIYDTTYIMIDRGDGAPPTLFSSFLLVLQRVAPLHGVISHAGGKIKRIHPRLFVLQDRNNRNFFF